jgi:hypothetical protein
MAPGGVPIVGSASTPFVYKVRPGSSGPSALASTNFSAMPTKASRILQRIYFEEKQGKSGISNQLMRCS